MKMHKHSNCVKVQFEIGHEAVLRPEITPQGFTHDWVVFVRGAENAEIHHFVEKVVFNLHESFPKPKRVIKEPPYEVRESGYASFAFPVNVYLKSKEEPRKFEFVYDLSLNTSGPISTSQREERLFKNPSEEFRRKLIRGGGVGIDIQPLTDNNLQSSEEKSSSKKSSSESKKHKSKDSVKGDDRTSNQFTDLFGTPIKPAQFSPTTTSKRSDSKHSLDKVPPKSLSKHSPHKEKEKEVSKKDTLNSSSSKEKDKDRERSKEKDKKAEKSLKRPPSPAATPPAAKVFKEDPKKSSHEESKERDKIKSSSSSDVSKNEKKDKKKDKKNRDEKDKKDRHKVHDKKELSTAPPVPLGQPMAEKERVSDKPDKNKSEFKESKENAKKSPKNVMKEDKFKEKNDKEKTESVEKQRHKHKKKEKDKKEEKESREKERDKPSKKSEKLPPTPPVIPKELSPPPSSKSKIRSPGNKNPLSALMLELPLSEKGSDTDSSGDDDVKSVENAKMSPSPVPQPPALNPPVNKTPERAKEEKLPKEKVKKRDKKNSKDEDGSRKKKRKSKEKEEVIPEKTPKSKTDEDSMVVREELVDEEVDERLSEPSLIGNSPQAEDEEVSRSRSQSPQKFTEEYVMELKDLQQKIMTLDDNAELQRVVQVISETGQYEITKKTFDFDLCALDKSTVKRLQELFFAAS